jgi:hypothetical protein
MRSYVLNDTPTWKTGPLCTTLQARTLCELGKGLAVIVLRGEWTSYPEFRTAKGVELIPQTLTETRETHGVPWLPRLARCSVQHLSRVSVKWETVESGRVISDKRCGDGSNYIWNTIFFDIFPVSIFVINIHEFQLAWWEQKGTRVNWRIYNQTVLGQVEYGRVELSMDISQRPNITKWSVGAQFSHILPRNLQLVWRPSDHIFTEPWHDWN